MLRALGVLKLEVVGGHKLVGCHGKLIVANHPTLIDIVLLMALVPDTKCVVKPALFSQPVLAPIVRAAGYIQQRLEAEVSDRKIRETLAVGIISLSFRKAPARCRASQFTFSAGFAHIATMAGVQLQPITINCEPITLVKGEPIKKSRSRAPFFESKSRMRSTHGNL